MSGRPCNYCDVKRLREQSAKTGATVHVVSAPLLNPTKPHLGFPDGVNVFVVPVGEKLNTSKDTKGNHGKQWKMWAAALPDHCVC